MDALQLVAFRLAKKLGIDASEITAETDLSTLGVDSLDAAELLLELEDKLGVEIEPSHKLTKVKDVVAEIHAIVGENFKTSDDGL